MRKHWCDYPSDDIGYGQHKYGFGIYHMNGLDYWDDPEMTTPHKKKIYKKYCKEKGFTKEESEQ